MGKIRIYPFPKEPDWNRLIPGHQWEIYERVIRKARDAGLEFVMGGGFALASYTGRWRNTKDLDLYVLPRDRDRMIRLVLDCGLKDYYEQIPYDRQWIFRTYTEDTIVDIIWSMANHRSLVDEVWLHNGPEVNFHGVRMRIIPPEEIVWDKLYIFQKDRCDWPEAFNLMYALAEVLDWDHIFDRLGDDWPVLRGALSVYEWFAPGAAQRIPDEVWQRVRLHAPHGNTPEVIKRRVDLLDTRQWFGKAA